MQIENSELKKAEREGPSTESLAIVDARSLNFQFAIFNSWPSCRCKIAALLLVFIGGADTPVCQ